MNHGVNYKLIDFNGALQKKLHKFRICLLNPFPFSFALFMIDVGKNKNVSYRKVKKFYFIVIF
jgi:hypothetical protein